MQRTELWRDQKGPAMTEFAAALPVVALVFTTLALVGVLGMTALVLDVGSWFRAQRDAQATADAAALAGAQFLPNGASAASSALSQAGKNGGGVAGANITITSNLSPSD